MNAFKLFSIITAIVAVILVAVWKISDTESGFFEFYDNIIMGREKIEAKNDVCDNIVPSNEEKEEYIAAELKDGFTVKGLIVEKYENGDYKVDLGNAILNLNAADIVKVEIVDSLDELAVQEAGSENKSYDYPIKWKSDVKSAFRLAKYNNKMVIIDFSTKWCGWCKKLNAITFSDKNVRSFINEKFIAVRIDGDKNRDLLPKYKVTGFPCVIFFDKNEKELGRIPGFLPPEYFIIKVKEFTEKK